MRDNATGRNSLRLTRQKRVWGPENTRPHGRSSSAEAFLPDPRSGAPSRSTEPLAEVLAEGFVEAATSAEEVTETVRDRLFAEDLGGPYIIDEFWETDGPLMDTTPKRRRPSGRPK